MNKMKKIVAFSFVLIMLLSVVATAATPYSTYTYSIDGLVLESPDAYVPDGDGAITYKTMGLEDTMLSPSDVEADAEGNLYITDKGRNRIIITNKYYEKTAIIQNFVNYDGVEDTFNTPVSTFVVNDGPNRGVYVCDKGNKRILAFSLDYPHELIRMIGEPEIEFDDGNAVYSPTSCVVDKHGRIYVVSDGTTDGIIVLTPEGEFINFIGAPKVSATGFDAIVSLFTSADQKDAAVPYSNIDLDSSSGDFVYATVIYKDATDKENQFADLTSKAGDYAPVRLLNASGADIMNRNGFFSPAGEVAVEVKAGVTESINKNAPSGVSELVDVTSGPNGVWSVVDSLRSKIYTYDKNGNLLYIFGDQGDKFGNIVKAAAITYQGDKIVVLDATNVSLTVYRPTEYANVLAKAIRLQNERNFQDAALAWQEVLTWNNNFDTAYVEMGKALFRDNDPYGAKTYFENAFDTENYAEAFKEIRSEVMSKYFPLLVVGIVVVAFLLIKLFGYAGKVNKAAATKGGKRTFKEEMFYGFHLMFHPFDGYWDLKHEKRGSVRASIVILACTVVAFYYQAIGQGYYYAPQGSDATIFSQAFGVLIPFFLFVIANWCFTTLFDGEGSFKDIFIATSYALFPVPAFVVVSTILTNVLVGTESQVTTMVTAVAYVWMIFLIIIGMQVTHDYSTGKNIVTIIATLVGMIVIMFIAVLFISLITKMVTFGSTIVNEIQLR